MKPASISRFGIVAGLALAASTGLNASTAFAAAQVQHFKGSIAGMPFNLGPSPAGLPPSCQFDNNDANFVFQSGTGVFHDTTNNNGDWGGATFQGTAVFYEDSTAIAQGHLTVWEGGGTNYPNQGQTESGLTANFTGTGPGGTVQIHVNGHMTSNAQGQPTADVTNVQVSCG